MPGRECYRDSAWLRIFMACGCGPSWILSHMTVVPSKITTSLRNFILRQFLSPMMSYHLCYFRRYRKLDETIFPPKSLNYSPLLRLGANLC
ncbi:hypothetical protein EDD85DRAFT_216164 [Armillaria nabsnona]|nr:hypothetical protein EDD85DRAFT_216164 [Armillaria nabsnona]